MHGVVSVKSPYRLRGQRDLPFSVQRVRAVAIACPACTTANISKAVAPYITSVVHGTDFVPYADLHSLDLMRQDVVASNWYEEWSKGMRAKSSVYRLTEGCWKTVLSIPDHITGMIGDCMKPLLTVTAACTPCRCGIAFLVPRSKGPLAAASKLLKASSTMQCTSQLSGAFMVLQAPC